MKYQLASKRFCDRFQSSSSSMWWDQSSTSPSTLSRFIERKLFSSQNSMNDFSGTVSFDSFARGVCTRVQSSTGTFSVSETIFKIQSSLRASIMASKEPYFFSIFWWWLRHWSAALVSIYLDISLKILSVLLSYFLRKLGRCSLRKSRYWSFSVGFQWPTFFPSMVTLFFSGLLRGKWPSSSPISQRSGF